MMTDLIDRQLFLDTIEMLADRYVGDPDSECGYYDACYDIKNYILTMPDHNTKNNIIR